jgi:hypothetical protein
MTDYAAIIDEYAKPSTPGVLGAVLRRISDIPVQGLSWLWPGRIPLGKLTLLAGDPGLGKSFVTLDIAARATTGKQWPDGAVNGQAGSVIILSAEDDAADTIRPRIEAAGANLDKVHILQAVRRVKDNGETCLDHFSLQTDIVALQDAVASLEDARLIILDPISAYLGSTDSHVNSKVRGLLAPLAGIAQGLRIAVTAVDHLSKSNRQALYRPNGSIAFTAAARAVWFFAKSPDDPVQRLMLPGKLNLAPEQTGLSYRLQQAESGSVTVAWGDAVSVTADSVLQPEDTEERSERLEAMDWLRERLSAGAVPAEQVRTEANSAGLAWMTVRRAKEALGVISRKGEGAFGTGWYWRFPVVEDSVPNPEDAHQTPKMLTSKARASSADVSIFDGHTYTPDPEGPGCTCQECGGHFGTVAGWRYHIVGKRCTPATEAVD